jgi:mannose-1-phosphate guanylyltransferase
VKAFLLAAGLGTRLKPWTDSVPKCLMPVGGVPILGIWLDACRRHGIEEVLINTHHLAGQVEDYVRSTDFGLRVHTVFEPELRGSAGTVRANWDFVRGSDAFFIIYTDSLSNADLAGMARFHESHSSVLTMAVFTTDDPQSCGIATVDQTGRITAFVEKPARPESTLANGGVYVAGKELFGYLPERVPADFGFEVLPQLTGRMFAFEVGPVIDIGTPRNYLRAEAEWSHEMA